MANAGLSADATITRSDDLPRAAARNASIARPRANGLAPLTSVVVSPPACATSPTRITCAPPAAFEPVGASALSAEPDAAGSDVPSLSSIGALTGCANSAEGAIPARQSPLSTMVPAFGRDAALTAGKTAWATPAAFATGSAPPTRVVFFVAMAGNPRPWAACVSVPLAPSLGLLVVEALPPQPASARQRVIMIARRMTAADDSAATQRPAA